MVGSRQVTIEFLGNSRDLSQAIDSAERSTGSLSRTMAKVGRAAALGFAAAAVVVGKGLYEAAQAAVEDQASQKQLATQLKNATGATDDQIASVESYIDSLSRATGVSDDELRPSLAKLATATGDVGKAIDLQRIAMDVAAGTGKSLSQVTDALVKAQNGSVGGLGRLGIATKDAEGKTKSFAAIQDELRVKFKGASAEAADTMQGKMARLKVAFNETMEAIGYKLLPVLTDLADWFLTKGLPAIQNFGDWMRNNLGPIFKDIGDIIGKVFGGDSSSKIGGNLAQIQEIVTQVVTIIRRLWDTFGADIIATAQRTWQNVQQVVTGFLNIISGILKVFSSLFQGDWQGVWDGIKQIWSGAGDVLLGLLKQFLNVLRLLWNVAWEGIKALAAAAWEGIKTLVRNGVDALVNNIKQTPGRFANALSALPGVLRDVFTTAMNAGLERVRTLGGDIVDWIRGIPGKLRGLADNFGSAGKALIDAFVNGLKNAGGVIEGIAGNVWSAVKSLLNAAISKINAALEFTISLPGPDITVNPPDIPQLAKGGIVRKPTLALIGEDGPEAVVPLGKKNAPKGSLGVGGSTTVQIFLQSLDPRGAGKVVVDALREYERQTGRPMLVSPS